MPDPKTPTGWPPGLLQDDSRDLSRALAGKPDAMRHAREAAAAMGVPPTPTDDLLDRLHAAAARKWTDDGNRAHSLFGQAAATIERLRAEVEALRSGQPFDST